MSRRDEAAAAIERATTACADFLANRPDGVEAQNIAVLAVVGPLIAVGRPKSRIRSLDSRVVGALLSRGLISVEDLT